MKQHLLTDEEELMQYKHALRKSNNRLKNQPPHFEQEKLQERLAKFTGGVAIVHVGGHTETEMREKKDRVDDALQATQAALEEGIVPGGGTALLYARGAVDSNDIGAQIVKQACSQPFTQILMNAGWDES